jgi:hypothetical protein
MSLPRERLLGHIDQHLSAIGIDDHCTGLIVRYVWQITITPCVVS